MISNFAAYNNHKRGTIERLTHKYLDYYSDIIEAHIKSNQDKIESALESGRSLKVSTQSLKEKLVDVFIDHSKYVVKAGVSDAMQEESVALSKGDRWSSKPIGLPVELALTSMAQITQRDLVSRLTNKFVSKKAKKIIEKIVDRQISGYLRKLEFIYEQTSDKYRNDEDSKDTRKKVAQIIRQITDTEKFAAERIFRTETTRYFNKARYDYFVKYTEVDFVQIIAVTDGRTSEICESRDLYIIPIEYAKLKRFTPPFHPNCRTILSPLNTRLKMDEAQVRMYLGSEFGTVVSKTSGKKFTGKRPKPNIPLPKGWA